MCLNMTTKPTGVLEHHECTPEQLSLPRLPACTHVQIGPGRGRKVGFSGAHPCIGVTEMDFIDCCKLDNNVALITKLIDFFRMCCYKCHAFYFVCCSWQAVKTPWRLTPAPNRLHAKA